jgi:hypothetical protein
MDEMEEIRRRLRISKLEAKLALCEIEAAALDREIASPLTFANRKLEADKRRDGLRSEASVIRSELDEMRRSYPLLARH